MDNILLDLLNSSDPTKAEFINCFTRESFKIIPSLSNDPGKVDSNFFCHAATVLSPHKNVLIFTQRMHKPT